MWKIVSVVLAGLLVASLTAQRPPIAATFLSNAEINAVRQAATGDIQMVIGDAGKYNVALATLRRESSGRQESPIVHEKVTEIYYVVDGSGMLLTGGTVTGAQASAPDSDVVKLLVGATTFGGTLQGATSRKIGKGDFVIIPPGVQHSFASIDGAIEYLMVRIDGDRVLPAGYVHEAIRKMR